MWCQDYEDRLRSWRDLRLSAVDLDLDSALSLINDWWWLSPMIPQSLSWRDFTAWPDPWQLLSQSGFCDLARALGIVYTVMLLDRSDVLDLMLCRTETNNLVQVNSGKYILNWSPGVIVNNLSPETVIQRTISSTALEKFIR